jgi:two-component SAPR family response regulator
MEKSSRALEKPVFNDIVVIEQDEGLRGNLSSLLHGYCRNLFSFESLKPAFTHLKRRSLPSVVVTDLYLPDGHSLDLIRSCVSQSEVIVISGQASQEEAFLLGKMGVKSYLKKPFDARRLNSVLDKFLESNKTDTKLTINTFGGLSIRRNDNEIPFTRKTPYKILEFIACILSFGARNVPVCRVCDYLWPDADGDKAEKSFTTCLRRARDLLDPHDTGVLIRKAGKISFNPEKVTIDLWFVDNSASHSMSERHCFYANEHFIQDWLPEYDHSWLIKPRENYRNLTKIFHSC